MIHCASARTPGPEVVNGACLTASGYEIDHSHHARNSLSHLNLSHMDSLDAPAGMHACTMIMLLGEQDESPHEFTNPEIFMKNHHTNIHSFGRVLHAIFPDTNISSCGCIVCSLKQVLRAMYCDPLRVSADPWALRWSLGLF